MNIKITADSTCDLSGALLQEWNISLMPMHILMGEENYLDIDTARDRLQGWNFADDGSAATETEEN